jgi:hypothetical protein
MAQADYKQPWKQERLAAGRKCLTTTGIGGCQDEGGDIFALTPTLKKWSFSVSVPQACQTRLRRDPPRFVQRSDEEHAAWRCFRGSWRGNSCNGAIRSESLGNQLHD